MAMPVALMAAARDLLRQPDTETGYNLRLEAAYQRMLQDFVREEDHFIFMLTLPTVAGQATYTAPTGTTRILAVFYKGTTLRLVPSRSLDLLATWESAPVNPETWSLDKIPNFPLPPQFVIHPPPLVSDPTGLTILRAGVPTEDRPPLQYWPFFLFSTLAYFCLEDTEERDLLAGNFWGALAGVWREVLQR